MKITLNQEMALVTGAAIIAIVFAAFDDRAHHSLPSLTVAKKTLSATAKDASAGKETNPASPAQPAVAPFIVQDTENDSPGTNIVTRIVTFSAEIGGTPPPALQWKVDKGNGFEVIGGATNAIYRIGNAQVSDSGFYSLFATNSAGGIHTAQQQLVVTEGED
ncbi:MAG TPA: immunoglobulin domain-containing protein [Pseudomonadales bacterium]|nr:immunoglobulin domain-containing protein [Pseudomonadales bacterium]